MKYIDLHIHLDGSLPPETIVKLAELSGYRLPADSPEALRPYLTVGAGCTDLNEYLRKFGIPLKVLQRADCLELAAYDLLRALSAQGVIYAEPRFAPGSHCARGLTQAQVTEAVLSGLKQGMRDFPIRANLILCCMRGADNHAANLETVRVAAGYRDKGVCCIDLAGAEALFPTREHGYIFDEAKRLEMPFIIHAGEAAGPDSVRAALDFGARRIGHGIAAASDPALLEQIRREKVPLEVCVTSNVQTKAVPDAAHHPIVNLLEQGIPVTLNTDNMTVSDTTLEGEFALVRRTFGLTPRQERQLLENAVNAAFLSAGEKSVLGQKLLEDIQ